MSGFNYNGESLPKGGVTGEDAGQGQQHRLLRAIQNLG
jgi:hypothetical protein